MIVSYRFLMFWGKPVSSILTLLLMVLVCFSPSLSGEEDIQVHIVWHDFRYLEDIETGCTPSFWLYFETLDFAFEPFSQRNNSELAEYMFLVDNGVEEVSVRFSLFAFEQNESVLCDLDAKQGSGGVEIVFNLRTGRWSGDDSLGDASGLGRLNGCDDGSFYVDEYDVQLCFDIWVEDEDKDRIPDEMESILGTDPLEDDSLRDDDGDGIPLWWEYRFGFDPFVFENHSVLDADDDGLNNFEEFRMAEWGSDPFRSDVFLELDEMQFGPNGQGAHVPEESKRMLHEAYAVRNIVFHLDDGCMGGGELIPFVDVLRLGEEKQYYNQYFLHGDENNWRRGVFRYALLSYHHFPISGLEFAGEDGGYAQGLNSFVLSTKSLEKKIESWFSPFERNLTYASVIMHELGHTMGIYIGNPPGCDNQLSRTPLGIGWWLYSNYVSCMNYHYCYRLLDYSDGSHGWGDFDDWSELRVSQFQPPSVVDGGGR